MGCKPESLKNESVVFYHLDNPHHWSDNYALLEMKNTNGQFGIAVSHAAANTFTCFPPMVEPERSWFVRRLRRVVNLSLMNHVQKSSTLQTQLLVLTVAGAGHEGTIIGVLLSNRSPDKLCCFGIDNDAATFDRLQYCRGNVSLQKRKQL